MVCKAWLKAEVPGHQAAGTAGQRARLRAYQSLTNAGIAEIRQVQPGRAPAPGCRPGQVIVEALPQALAQGRPQHDSATARTSPVSSALVFAGWLCGRSSPGTPGECLVPIGPACVVIGCRR